MPAYKETRDLLEDREGEYPAHITIRDFNYEGTNLAGSIWLGSENQASEVDVLVTDEDLEWIIRTLQQVLDKAREAK